VNGYFGLSTLLGVMASLNIYFILATMGSNQIPAKPSYAMTGAFALLAVVLFVGAVAILSQRGEKS
jgi:uncharacterized membrane protein